MQQAPELQARERRDRAGPERLVGLVAEVFQDELNQAVPREVLVFATTLRRLPLVVREERRAAAAFDFVFARGFFNRAPAFLLLAT